MKIAVLYNMVEPSPSVFPLHDYEGRQNDDNVLSVIMALKKNRHEVISVYADINFIENLRSIKPDLVFNLCDEGFEHDSQLEPHIAAVLDLLQVPYTGADYLTLATCLNKARTKEILLQNNIITATFQVFTKKTEQLNPALRFPLIVKPSKEDASIGIRQDSVVETEEQLRKKLSRVIKDYKQPALVEEYIDGRELNVGILGNHDARKNEIIILPVSEIIFELPPGKRKICCYEAKWVKEDDYYKQTIPQCPAKISKELERAVKKTALNAYKLMQCNGYGRVDFRVKDGIPYVLEVNPNPDISTDAGLARMAKTAGFDYAEMIEKIAQIAAQKNKNPGPAQNRIMETAKSAIKEATHANI